jgi:hypothetical protein
MLITSGVTFVDRIATATKSLGEGKANQILSALITSGHRLPTLREQAIALETAAKNQPATSPPRAAPAAPTIAAKTPATAPAEPEKPGLLVKARSANEVARGLLAQYQMLETDQERRAFYQKNESALADPAAEVSGLVSICLIAAKPVSVRALAGMHFSVAEPGQGTKAAARAGAGSSPQQRLASVFEPRS